MEREPNFYFLLAGLVLVLVLESLIEAAGRGGALTQIVFSGLLVFGVLSLHQRPWVFRTGAVLAVLGLGTSVAFAATGYTAIQALNFAIIVAFLLLAVGVMARPVLLGGSAVDVNRIAGGLCIYLMLGVIFAVFYGGLELTIPSAFHYATGDAGATLDHFLYYSFVTLTTLGYGDITPVHPVARTLSYLEAVVGQLYIAVLVASLVARYVANESRRGA